MEHTQTNIEKHRKRAQLHRQRKRRVKLIRRLLLASILFIFIVFIILLILGIRDSKRVLEPISIVTDNANPNRDSFINIYLEETFDVPLDTDDIFSIEITPLSNSKCSVRITNNTEAFFTGIVKVHDLATFSLDFFAPKISKTFEVDLGLKKRDSDYTYNGTFHTYIQKPDLDFKTAETPINDNQIKVNLYVNTLTDQQKIDLAYYYYIIGTLYNNDSPTEYILYNANDTINFGSLVVDAKRETVDLFENGMLVLTADF